MAGKRNKFLELIKYYESLGITVNVGKNKARGNKGIFLANSSNKFRIDISKTTEDDAILSTLLHEFAHYLHFRYDKKLKSLDFIFENLSDEETEELLKITVHKVPKDTASSLYDLKTMLADEVKLLADSIKTVYPKFCITTPFAPIERSLSCPAKYLLKYDNIIYNNRKYSIKNIKEDFKTLSDVQLNYILLRSKRRRLARINARITKLNQYYNAPTELWARFFELFFIERNTAQNLAPLLSAKFSSALETKKIKEISTVNEILKFII